MASKEKLQGGELKLPLFNLISTDFATTARQRLGDFADAQAELLNIFQEINQHWRDRISAEAKVEADFASKLTAARSIPDVVTTCQEWGSRHLEMVAEDAAHLFDDTQKLMQTSARLFANIAQR